MGKKVGWILLVVFLLLSYEHILHTTQSEHLKIQRYHITFRILSSKLPASSAVFITGDNTILGNFDPYRIPLQRRPDGSWERTFYMPESLHVRCLFNLGTPLSRALNQDGSSMDTLRFIVRRDTLITLHVAQWNSRRHLQSEAARKLYDADNYFHRAHYLSITGDRDGHIDSSRFYYNKAARLYEELQNWQRLAHTLHYMRGVYPVEDRLPLLNKALAICLEKLGTNHLETAELYSRLGEYYKARGDLKQAEQLIRKALAIKDVIERKGLTKEHFFNYYHLAEIYQHQKQFNKALAAIESTRQVVENVFGSLHQDMGHVENLQASLYSEMGEHEKAIKALQRSLNIFFLFNDTLSVSIHMGYFHLGTLYMRAQRYRSAREAYQKALRIRKAMFFPEHSHIISAYSALSSVSEALQEYDRALAEQQQAESLLLASKNFSPDNSQPNSEEAIFQYSHLPLYLQKGRLLLKAAQHQFEHGFKNQAIRLYTRGLAAHEIVLQKTRAIIGSSLSDAGQLAYLNQSKALTGKAIAAALRLYRLTGDKTYQEAAWRFSEQSRAALLQYAYQVEHSDSFKDADSMLIQQEIRLRNALIDKRIKLLHARSIDSTRAIRLDELEKSYRILKARHESAVLSLQKKYPRYVASRLRRRTPTIAELQKSLDPQTAILEYFLEANHFFVFVITRDNFSIIPLSIPVDFHQQLEKFNASLRSIVMQDNVQAALLGQTLISPIEYLIRDKKALIILPDNELYTIPFEALRPGGKSFLIQQYAISYHYATDLLFKKHHNFNKEPFSGYLLAMAPVFTPKSSTAEISPACENALNNIAPAQRSELLSRNGKYLRFLRYSEQECRQILTFFNQNKNMGLFHEQATEYRFKQLAGRYRIIHLATHGFSNLTTPDLSGLIFSQNKTKASEDGILFSGESSTLNLGADLVVLSSCESGIGKIVAGEGVMSIARGFIGAGARNAVVSLWKVYDKYTSQLMVEFYRQIAAGKSYAEALRSAKLRMLANPATARPAAWAAFILIGK